MALYRRVLGEGFDGLPPVLRRFHTAPSGATGTLQVTRGRGWLTRILAALLRLPSPGERVPVTLEVLTDDKGERWVRHFGAQRLVTRQWEHGSLLRESAGPLHFGFQLKGNAEGIVFVPVRCWFLGIPVPERLAPQVTAAVRGTERGWWLSVSLTLRGIGLLMHYEGELVPC